MHCWWTHAAVQNLLRMRKHTFSFSLLSEAKKMIRNECIRNISSDHTYTVHTEDTVPITKVWWPWIVTCATTNRGTVHCTTITVNSKITPFVTNWRTWSIWPYLWRWCIHSHCRQTKRQQMSLCCKDKLVHTEHQIFFFSKQQIEVLKCLSEDKWIHPKKKQVTYSKSQTTFLTMLPALDCATMCTTNTGMQNHALHRSFWQTAPFV